MQKEHKRHCNATSHSKPLSIEGRIDGGLCTCTMVSTFKCIMKEAELMFELLRCQFDTTELVSLSNQIRRSVWNLMRYQVDESTMVPAAAAMVVCACSLQTFRDLVNICVVLF